MLLPPLILYFAWLPNVDHNILQTSALFYSAELINTIQLLFILPVILKNH